MSGPFATAANRLVSIASKVAGVKGRANALHDDMVTVADTIRNIYDGTNGGTDVTMQADAIIGTLSDIQAALQRLEQDLRAAAARAAGAS